MVSMKNVTKLSPSDFEAHPIWEYLPEHQNNDETFVVPVQTILVEDLSNRLVACRVQLASEMSMWALLGNIDLTSERMTNHFLTISFRKDKNWFHLARYHDPDYAQRGPIALAKFLGMPGKAIFPISYDLSNCVVGMPNIVRGQIDQIPKERLSRSELIALAV